MNSSIFQKFSISWTHPFGILLSYACAIVQTNEGEIKETLDNIIKVVSFLIEKRNLEIKFWKKGISERKEIQLSFSSEITKYFAISVYW